MPDIEKSVPLPRNCQAGAQRIYPFPKMAVGSSFFTPLPEDAGPRAVARLGCTLRSSANYFATTPEGMGRRFTIRRALDAGVDGFRCWRFE